MSPERDLILFAHATSAVPAPGRRVAQPAPLQPASVIGIPALVSSESARQTALSKFAYFHCRILRINYRQRCKRVLTDIHQTVINSIKIKTIRCIFC